MKKWLEKFCRWYLQRPKPIRQNSYMTSVLDTRLEELIHNIIPINETTEEMEVCRVIDPETADIIYRFISGEIEESCSIPGKIWKTRRFSEMDNIWITALEKFKTRLRLL